MDLAPEGFIHLPECYERYCLWLWKDHRPREELDVERRIASLPGDWALAHRTRLASVTDETTSEITRLFVSGKLQALVRSPGQAQNFVIPKESWRDAFFPERLFEEFGERWGLSPFGILPDTVPFDPMQVLHWTLAMAVAWIAWRDVSQVRNAWGHYRQECWEWFGFSRRCPFEVEKSGSRFTARSCDLYKPPASLIWGWSKHSVYPEMNLRFSQSSRPSRSFGALSAREKSRRPASIVSETLPRFAQTSGRIWSWRVTTACRTMCCRDREASRLPTPI